VVWSPFQYFAITTLCHNFLRFASFRWLRCGRPFISGLKSPEFSGRFYKFFGKGKHFGIVAQAARDHYRTICTFDGIRDYADALYKPKHWYWATKAVMVF
jgi:hypothetical protein